MHKCLCINVFNYRKLTLLGLFRETKQQMFFHRIQICFLPPVLFQFVFCLFVCLFLLRTVHKRLSQGLPLETAGPNAQLSSAAKEHHLAVARALWRNFFPYLKSQRMLPAPPPPQLADTAAGLYSLYSSLVTTLHMQLVLGTFLFLFRSCRIIEKKKKCR